MISCVSDVANPQQSDVSVNPATQANNSRLRPTRLASHPEIGSTTAFETRYDVTTHVPSSFVAARFPEMWGMATLTTVVSSTSMNVAGITAQVTTHGFTARCGLASTREKSAENSA